MSAPKTVWIGVVLTLAGPLLLGCAIRWLAPKPHVALEMPVSLSPGHVTGNFRVTPDSLYHIDVELDKRSPVRADCEPRFVLGTRWVLSSDGGTEQGSSRWEDTGLTIASLYSDKTKYAFDVEILPGATCLNANKPRLKVQTHPNSSDLYVGLTWLSIVPIGIGLVLLIRPHINSRLTKVVEGTRIFPDMIMHNVLPIAKHAPLRPIHDPPHWPLFWVAIMSILMFTFMIFRPLPSKGLLVTWKNRDSVAWGKSPWPDTLVVYVRAPSHFFINGQDVPRSDLQAKLIEQLNHRVEWSVYFEAEPDVPYSEAVYAIEKIQTCGAKLIWVTPQMREAWQNKSKESGPSRQRVDPILRQAPRKRVK